MTNTFTTRGPSFDCALATLKNLVLPRLQSKQHHKQYATKRN